jgi:D-alanine-D-alanine ligase
MPGLQKMNIVVLAGGLSPERDVSLSSGCMIANALIENGHNALLADVYMGLPDAENFAEARQKYMKARYEYKVPEREPDLEAVKAARDMAMSGAGGGGCGSGRLIGEGVLPVCADADVTFNALHGAIGENGQLQAVFDVYGVKYTGTRYEGSFIAMDKPLAKDLMRLHGLDTPDWTVIETNGAYCASALERVELPCVIKPCGCGSSVGVSIVNDENELDAAYQYARLYEKRIIIEQKITGREFSVGVLGGEALPPIEIIPRTGFFDYKNKYQPGAALEICPARDLTPELEKKMRDGALKAHRILRLGDYSRTDVIMDGDGRLFFLEANTLPGMTPTSLLPKEAAAAGISYNRLCEKIVELALARYAE